MALVTIKGLKAVADLDLQIRGGGGHLDPETRWEPFFRPFGPQFGPQIRGWGVVPRGFHLLRA